MKPQNSESEELSAEALADMIDRLIASGSQHINVKIGEEARIQTVNSTECSPKGACAVPNSEYPDEEEEM